MPIVEHAVTVRGPIEDVFDLSQSYALRLDWDPFVRSQRPLGGATQAAKGVRTETVSRHRLRMVTEYLTFRRPTLVGMKMTEGPPIFSTFSGSWRFAERDDGRVDVAFRYNFTCRPSWLAPVMHRIGTWYLGRDIAARIEAFRAACDDTDLLDRLHSTRPDDRPTTASEPAEFPPPIVDVAWLREHVDAGAAVVFADVRTTMTGVDPRAAFDAGHLPGATFVSLEDDLSAVAGPVVGRHPLPDPADFAEALAARGIGDDVTVFAYDDRGGAFAARLVWMLRVIGQPAALVDGGPTDALAELVNVRRRDDDRSSRERRVRTWPGEAIADADEVAAQIAAGGVVVDSRDAARYRGEIEPIDRIAGHIPGAINLPYTHNLEPTGHVRPTAELAVRFADAGVDASSIVYCGSGVTACHNVLAIEHAGGGRPRLYVGSWSGWSSDPARPVATGDDP